MANPNSRLHILLKCLVWLIPTCLCGCMGDTTHLVFSLIAADGWRATDTLHYSIMPTPQHQSLSSAEYHECGMSVLLHTDEYAYRNIAFRVIVEQDSLLYDAHHTFMLGECEPVQGIGQRCDYTLPITNITYNDTLPLVISLQHNMDTICLPGIRSVGVRLGACNKMPGEIVWQVEW